VAETAFAVTYEGPSVADGTMPVRQLAPALLALGELFADASQLLYPDRAPVALNIKATERGSFLVQLLLEAERAWDDLIDISDSDTLLALATLETLVIGGGQGVLWLIKRLKNRRIVGQEPAPAPGVIRLTLDDQTTVEIPSTVLTMYERVDVRRKARQVVSPLESEGIESVSFQSSGVESLAIEKEDLPAYEVAPGPEEPLLESEQEMVVEIAAVVFTEGNKWRFSDGTHTFFAAMEDRMFLERVERGDEAFRKGDMLRCRMRIVQSRTASGLQTDYRVVRVLEHLPRATQLTIDA
jgi:hypothetical protein